MKVSKKFLSLLLSMAMVLSVSVPAFAAEMDDKLIVIHTNDIHGYYETTETSIGIAGVVGLKQYYEGLGAEVLLFDAGDFSQGQTLVNYSKGEVAGKYLAAAGYDAVSLGNHEFDFGYEAMQKIVAALGNVPVVDANILEKRTAKPTPAFDDNVIFEKGDIKVGVFGLDTAETMTKSSPSSVKNITFVDGKQMFAIAQAQVDELKAADCDYIIALTHLGVDDESIGRRSTDLAEAVEGIDLVIDGHSHTVMDGGQMVGDTMIVSTGSYLENVGTVTIDEKTLDTSAKLISAADYAANFGVYDEALTKLVAEDKAVVDKYYAGTFATTLVDLNGEREPGVRTEETNLGDFSADAMLYAGVKYAKAEDLDVSVDVAISNGGSIRASIPAGEISMNTLYTVFPYGNTLVLATVTGEQLLEAMEASVFCTPTALGGFPQVAGMEFTINTAIEYSNKEQYPDSTYFAPATPGSRVEITSIGGKDFDPKANYTVVLPNFLAEGGDTYYVMTKASYVQDTGIVDAEALIDYVNSLKGVIGEEYKEPQGRIKFIEKLPEIAIDPIPAEPVEAPEEPVVTVPAETLEELYKVVAGDSLWRIAKAQLGNGERWSDIYDWNKEKIANPGMIYIGQEFVINQ